MTSPTPVEPPVTGPQSKTIINRPKPTTKPSGGPLPVDPSENKVYFNITVKDNTDPRTYRIGYTSPFSQVLKLLGEGTLIFGDIRLDPTHNAQMMGFQKGISNAVTVKFVPSEPSPIAPQDVRRALDLVKGVQIPSAEAPLSREAVAPAQAPTPAPIAFSPKTEVPSQNTPPLAGLPPALPLLQQSSSIARKGSSGSFSPSAQPNTRRPVRETNSLYAAAAVMSPPRGMPIHPSAASGAAGATAEVNTTGVLQMLLSEVLQLRQELEMERSQRLVLANHITHLQAAVTRLEQGAVTQPSMALIVPPAAADRRQGGSPVQTHPQPADSVTAPAPLTSTTDVLQEHLKMMEQLRQQRTTRMGWSSTHPPTA